MGMRVYICTAQMSMAAIGSKPAALPEEEPAAHELLASTGVDAMVRQESMKRCERSR